MDEPWTPERIRELRKRFGLTRRALAEMLGTTVTSLYRWDTGRSVPHNPTMLLLTRIEQELTEKHRGGKK